MADSFHFNISMISRGKGKSAVASAAYISCEKLTNEWDGITHDYHNKKGLLHSQIFLPENIPKEFQDRSFLWNSVEPNEKASNAQLARSFIIALPKELSVEENKRLITDFIQKNFVSKGMIADLAIHDESNDGNNKDFYNEHTAEIILFESAKKYLKEHLGESKTLNISKWKSEVIALKKEKNSRYNQILKIRKEVEQAESVRNCKERLLQENRELTQVKKHELGM